MPSAFQPRRFSFLSGGVCLVFAGLVEWAAAQAVAPWATPAYAPGNIPALPSWNAAAPSPWNAAAAPMYPGVGMVDAGYGGAQIAQQFAAAPPQASRPRGPIARLVRNRDASSGLPPYALTDQSGAIQRYVEPMPGIDLSSHVGSIVVVRHDTGRTLLASQLELPALSMETVSDRGAPNGRRTKRSSARRTSGESAGVRRAQYVDHDDSTVELLSDGETAEPDSAPDAASPEPVDEPEATIEAIPDSRGMEGHHEGLRFDGQEWSEELPPGAGPSFGQSFGDPMYDDGMVAGPSEHCHQGDCCPHCNGQMMGDPMMVDPTWGEPTFGGGDFLGLRRPRSGANQFQIFADVQFNFLRLHLMEDAVGKLSEKYEFSPRFILGFEGGEISDGRVRYWTYGRDTERLRGGRIRFEFEVLDIEATQRFQIRRSDIVVGAGFRMAAINGEDTSEDEFGADLLGMTVAAEAHTHICRLPQGRLAWVFGGRLSLLGGDWGGDESNNFTDGRARDDNVVADELFGGIEYSCSYRRIDWHARLAFEMQNWHSDVFAQQAGTDSIGFLGPGVHVGAQF